MLPDDPLVEEVLIPCFRIAASVDSMVGFFSSESLVSLAPGLATFVSNSNESIRLIICPILSESDRDAILKGTRPPEDVAATAISDLLITENMIVKHTLRCLTWLLQNARLEIQVALMKSAMFHPKVWLFRSQGDTVAVHGSSNMTHAGIRRNIEQVAVSKSWDDSNQRYSAQRLHQQFSVLWNGADHNCITVPVPDALREGLVRIYGTSDRPKETDIAFIYGRAQITLGDRGDPTKSTESNRFNIPESIKYEEGPFAHQGQAVKAWLDSRSRGILEMATGSGKTIVALIAAHRLYEVHKPLLIVVAAPYVPIIQQWCDEISSFGVRAINLTDAAGPRGRARELGKIRRRLRSGTSDVELIVVSHITLSNGGFREEIGRFPCLKLLIADEAHNLGSEGFIADPPMCFDHTLGLSATPVRQYDDHGTQALLKYLGPVVFRFPLSDAIGRCLVEYDYYVHRVVLTDDEMDRWYELTDRIRANSWRADESEQMDAYLKKLLRERRVILESAQNKIGALAMLLDSEDLGSFHHTLVYASDKAPGQLEAVNKLLTERNVLFHQLTYVETGNREETKRIIRAFQEGTLKVLTAKRVLDEGCEHSGNL